MNKLACTYCRGGTIIKIDKNIKATNFICRDCGTEYQIHKTEEKNEMKTIKELWDGLLKWTAKKGISPKGTVWVISAFILGAWLF